MFCLAYILWCFRLVHSENASLKRFAVIYYMYHYYVHLDNPEQDPEVLCLDGRFNHHLQLQNRLDFIR